MTPSNARPASAPRTSWLRRWRDRLARANAVESDPAYSFEESAARVFGFLLRPRSWLHIGIFTVLVGWFLWQASIYWPVTIDDAYITFRFADNLIHGHGFVFNAGGERVEGYSNFLWLLGVAVALVAGVDPMYFAKVAGLGCAITLMAVTWAFAASLRNRDDAWNLLPAALLATNAHFAHWALMGLETHLAVLLIVAAYHRFHREMGDGRLWLLSPILATLAAMTRIDSLYYLVPLGILGAALVLGARVPFRRFAAWSATAALLFGAYYGWRTWYFGDLLPNTYYAKQRFVDIAAERQRGLQHIAAFYWEHNPGSAPAPPATIRPVLPPDADLLAAPARVEPVGAIRRGLDSAWWLTRGGNAGTIGWINWWVACLAVLLLWPRWRVLLLVAAPIVLNLYYVYHVDGDWMPNFRFFMVALPFWGVAGAIAAGHAWKRLRSSASAARPVLVAGVLLSLTTMTAEHARTGYVYLFGGDPIWIPREAGWGAPRSVSSAYDAGFSPPLDAIANWVMLKTTNGATIYMSDIGQPMWYAPHLALLDGCGLCSKRLGHAPSARGDLPSEADLLDRMIAAEDPAAAPGPRMDQLRVEAARLSFQQQVERNASWIVDEVRPEYVVLFQNHEDGDVTRPFYIYPEIAAAIHAHPRFAERYEVIDRIQKIGNVWNTIYRRRDHTATPDELTRAGRIERAFARNPRMTALARAAIDLAREARDEAAYDRAVDTAEAILRRNRSATGALMEVARAVSEMGEDGILDVVLSTAASGSPGDPRPWRMQADRAWAAGRKDEAIRFAEGAVERALPVGNGDLQVLSFFLQSEGRLDEAARLSARAIRRDPRDERAWLDLAAAALRASWGAGVDPETRRRHRLAALAAYETLATLQGGTGSEALQHAIADLRAEFDQPPAEQKEKGG